MGKFLVIRKTRCPSLQIDGINKFASHGFAGRICAAAGCQRTSLISTAAPAVAAPATHKTLL